MKARYISRTGQAWDFSSVSEMRKYTRKGEPGQEYDEGGVRIIDDRERCWCEGDAGDCEDCNGTGYAK